MKKYLVMTAAVVLAGAAVLASSPAGARTLAPVPGRGGGWGKPEQVPGTAALNRRGLAQVTSVSCASAGNSSAGGTGGSSTGQAFVVGQVHGTWEKAEAVTGTTVGAAVNSMSCPSAGHCSAGGFYTDGHGRRQAFVVSRT